VWSEEIVRRDTSNFFAKITPKFGDKSPMFLVLDKKFLPFLIFDIQKWAIF
jgi:hypothetical protein